MEFKSKEQKIGDTRLEGEKMYREFLEGEGRLPKGFSFAYNRTSSLGVYRGTPFDTLLREISEGVDKFTNDSGISDWLYLSESVEINAAVTAIVDWVKKHREMANLLNKKYNFWTDFYCWRNIMVVVDSGDRFNDITEESVQSCKAAGISFCTILSTFTIYDLLEQGTKELTWETYPNYHDETHGRWRFV